MFFKLFKNSLIVLHNLGLIKRKYFKKPFGKMTMKIYMQTIYITLLQCKEFSTDNLSLRDKNNTTTGRIWDQNLSELSVNTDQTPTVFLTDLKVDDCRIILTVQRSTTRNQRMEGREPCIYLRKRNHLPFQLSQKIQFSPDIDEII